MDPARADNDQKAPAQGWSQETSGTRCARAHLESQVIQADAPFIEGATHGGVMSHDCHGVGV